MRDSRQSKRLNNFARNPFAVCSGVRRKGQDPNFDIRYEEMVGEGQNVENALKEDIRLILVLYPVQTEGLDKFDPFRT
jgi:hypothetical protein